MYPFDRYLNIRSAFNPVLLSDQNHLAFLSDISGNYQVWRVALGEAGPPWPEQLTFFSDKVWELHSTPAANHLLAVSDVGGNEKQQFYLLEFDSADGHTVRRLTEDDTAIHRFGAWSADGQHIVFTSNARNQADFDYYRLNLQTGESTLLAERPGNREIVAWSPEQNYLLVLDSVGPLETRLYRFELSTGAEIELTAQHPPARYSHFAWRGDSIFCLSDQPHDRGAVCALNPETGALTALVTAESHPTPGEFDLLTVNRSGSEVAYLFNADGYSQLYTLPLSNPQPTPRPLPAEGVIKHLKFSPQADSLVFDLQTPTANPNIWQMSLTEGTSRQLTASNRAGIPSDSLIAPTLIRYPTFDGREIPAFCYRPATPPPAEGYPCILYVHGGPTSQVWPDFDVRFQYFLQQGYAILAPNVRGSTGYGREYAALDEQEKRMDSVADLKHAVLWLKNQADFNGQRVVIYGRSYGGFMVLAALTEYPDLFTAGIDVVGISNWETFLERTGHWRRSHREREYGSLSTQRDLLKRISPIHKADNIRVPLMVVAGDNDPRVPLSESAQIVERVKAAGGETHFLHYADEGHKLSKLANRIDCFTQMAAFLRKYL